MFRSVCGCIAACNCNHPLPPTREGLPGAQKNTRAPFIEVDIQIDGTIATNRYNVYRREIK
jgi:hypothetical protein